MNPHSFRYFYSEILYKSDTKYKDPHAPIFITVGTGGAELHNFTGTVPYVVKQLESHGFLNVDVKNQKQQLLLSGTFYENQGMNK